MKLTSWIAACLLAAAVQTGLAAEPAICMNESILPCEGGFLVPNYGTPDTTPQEGKSYILYYDYKQKKLTSFIETNPSMIGPTGMALYGDTLFVCNRRNVLAYDRRNLQKPPRVVSLAADDRAVNDAAVAGDTLYVTVTNTDRVYAVDLTQFPWEAKVWLTLPGPNGLAVCGDTIYVASIPKDYATPGEENVVYVVPDRKRPEAERFNSTPGLYDGVAVSADGRTVYVSDWATASVKAVDAATKTERTIYHEPGLSPADIALDGDTLLIPDMLHSWVIILSLPDGETEVVGG